MYGPYRLHVQQLYDSSSHGLLGSDTVQLCGVLPPTSAWRQKQHGPPLYIRTEMTCIFIMKTLNLKI